jgi:hypothetical protein
MMFGGGGHGINLGGTLGQGADSTGLSRMALARSEEDFGKAFEPRIMKRLWRFMAPYKLRVAMSVLLLLT